MFSNSLLIAQHIEGPTDALFVLRQVAVGIVFILVVLGIFLVPFRIWQNRARQRGYPGLLAYLKDLPQTDEAKLDAVELMMKGVVICILGLLFPPLVLIGAVPLYYGGRKIAATILGIDTVDEQ
jgi:hypothetical protein